MQPVLDLMAKFGPARLAAMGAVTLVLVGFFAFVILRVSRPELGVLYADLSLQDAGAVIRDLEARGIRYETRGDLGQTILAPRADLPRLRMDLAGKGLPSAGGVGYELFDKGDAFSTTTFVQNVNHLRAQEGELARSIRAIGRVQAARVHLVIPEKRLFNRDRELPSAAIVLKLAGDLDPGQVRAVRHLVASSVEGLKPERISIVDERGRLLADGAGRDDAQAVLGLDERQASLEQRLRAQVEGIVAGIVGAGRARVQVAAELDPSRIESRSESFDPESRVVRSSQTRSETSASQGPGETGVSVGNELPGARETAQANGTRETSNKNEETTNYEISRVTRTEVNEGGRIKRLSVAVVIDGSYQPGPDGKPVYAPRSQEELDRITALVRTAVGYDKGRGDQVEVANLRFADTAVPAELPEEGLLASLLKPTKEEVLRLVELAVLALLTLVVVLAVMRPLLRRVLPAEAPPEPALAAVAVLPAAGAEGEGAPALPESPARQLVEFAKINGKIQAETIARVAEIVRQNPVETAEVLRGWIQDR
ncbi:flagellar M-ring protein FliF [Methylobacterium sp. 4-46]|uniref:flagellar basal-body MS-ring/collar protein FliF n=1 Tax=unclassified Methylobacterium TaxID=2615210 RepID=UPI000152D63D|nr:MULTISPECIES: flagellar basal-body MS-ring/collar protein FliF [Methylobacterium]ACA19452.1 flagellar M-ring protein FliF [Methylobacterium sp. 4-46]WFT78651.1 flagellar basal-body MS-ring/collar protein FliF [Methylobacterium nodulans]